MKNKKKFIGIYLALLVLSSLLFNASAQDVKIAEDVKKIKENYENEVKEGKRTKVESAVNLYLGFEDDLNNDKDNALYETYYSLALKKILKKNGFSDYLYGKGKDIYQYVPYLINKPKILGFYNKDNTEECPEMAQKFLEFCNSGKFADELEKIGLNKEYQITEQDVKDVREEFLKRTGKDIEKDELLLDNELKILGCFDMKNDLLGMEKSEAEKRIKSIFENMNQEKTNEALSKYEIMYLEEEIENLKINNKNGELKDIIDSNEKKIEELRSNKTKPTDKSKSSFMTDVLRLIFSVNRHNKKKNQFKNLKYEDLKNLDGKLKYKGATYVYDWIAQ